MLLFVGDDEQIDREGHDRDFLHLPGAQHELIQAVYAANPKTASAGAGSPPRPPPAGLLRATISQYSELGSLEFSKKLLLEADVAVSPGIGFGDQGDGHVRFSLIENVERTRQALRGVKQMFRAG